MNVTTSLDHLMFIRSPLGFPDFRSILVITAHFGHTLARLLSGLENFNINSSLAFSMG